MITLVGPFVRQQKLAKEEERAAREAEKAAEEAKTKARQAAIDEENRKKKEEERLKREAAKRAADEEKARKEEEKRKRQQEEREREQERERRKKEREERSKKDREERERKAKEERARLAKEREEKAERDRIEKEKKAEKERQEKERLRLKKEKEEKEKEEREVKEKEKLAAQKAAAAAQPKTPIRLNATASSSTSSLSASKSNPPGFSPPLQRTPNTSGSSAVNGVASGSKKSKPAPVSAPPGVVGQPSRSQSQGSQPLSTPHLSRPPHIPPVSISPHLPQQTGMMYGPPPVGQVPVIVPPSLSPRVNTFPPMQYQYTNSTMQHAPGTSIVPPTSSQPFNAGPSSFDPAVSFNRVPIPPIGVPLTRGGLTASSNPPTPIGPPKGKSPLTGTATPGPSMFASGRRASLAAISAAGGPGPITRPIAPIARPSTTTTGDGTTSSGSGSPSRRSPSPKGVLGSSALAADDDEVVPKAHARRMATTTPIGTMAPLQSWGPASPRAALNPWAAPGAGNYPPSPSRAGHAGPVGGSNVNGALHVPVGSQPSGVPNVSVPPTGVESLWVNNTPSDAWHPQSGGGPFFHGPNQYLNHHSSAAASAPHAAS